MLTAIKPKECRQCGASFIPFRFAAKVCSPTCARRYVAETKKIEKATLKARKEAIKTYSEWKADAQKAVNEYVRLRDQGKPCISCQKPWDATFQAGHYRSRGAAPQLALDPRNIAGQCVQCNLHKHGNQAAFRLGLIEREGVALVEALESDNDPLKLSVDELRQVKVIHKGLARELKKDHS
jgi:hypothetical protein